MDIHHSGERQGKRHSPIFFTKILNFLAVYRYNFSLHQHKRNLHILDHETKEKYIYIYKAFFGFSGKSPSKTTDV